ncbi:F0F1 ATP synthase subunit epsilon [Mycoplasma struthionis]|uniref:F0F1 ATP synthase subunit epsilon n=1 Tax=Mycoplasma struthionis TaxID=538220 RepID=A0A3G8LGB8_9MOLU|nr:F0F1 ATP synthase subunit epsilon [Mycoplasma struthionis]AZG68686.1 F0F1 ATP synthase subunit epsilon [Mycoplasma struthionis]TPI01936.1 F0F1 ATP synthase subunit epsilon [Mycoplasma struthionis]
MAQEKLIHVIISTPLGNYYDDYVRICTFQTTEGEIGLMADATSFTGSIVPSKILLTKENHEQKTFYVNTGVAQFQNNTLSFIVSKIDEKPLDLETQFVKEDQKKYTIIEEVVLKKKILDKK